MSGENLETYLDQLSPGIEMSNTAAGFSNFTQSNINLEPLQGHFYDLSEIKNAFKDLNEGKIIRPIIKMQH